MKRRLHLLTTGGTIEKTYDENEGTLLNRGSFVLKQIQQKLRLPHTEIIHTELLCKDSLDMTDLDREILLAAVKEKLADGCPILILHGTDTMVMSASHIKKYLTKLNAPVLLTGAMTPLGFENSDALQNVTEALALAFILPKDVWICFHSEVFDPFHTEKNRKEKTFSHSR